MSLDCASSATEVIVVVMRIQGGGGVYVMIKLWAIGGQTKTIAEYGLSSMRKFGCALAGISTIPE